MNRQQRRAPVVKNDRFAPDEITVVPGLRALDDRAVARLADSINAIGLQSPLTVRWVKDANEEGDDVVLVAGRHRLAAVQRLGWPLVECAVVVMDDREARLWEIAENLHRAELTKQERADHIAEWVRLTDEKVAQVGQPLGGHQPAEKGISKTAAELGVSRQEAQRANKIAAMAPETKAEVAADPQLADNQAALLRVASHPTPALQLMQIKAERDKAEAQKRNRQSDRDAARSQAEQYAEWMLSLIDLDDLPMLLAWMEGTKIKDVTTALRRRTA